MKLFKRLAKSVVTIYANYIYNKAVKMADERFAREHTMIYVASRTFKPDHLTTYNNIQFKREKQAFGYYARLLSLQTLKNGCYYHTPDKAGNQALTERDKEIRRQAFVRERLVLAKLI